MSSRRGGDGIEGAIISWWHVPGPRARADGKALVAPCEPYALRTIISSLIAAPQVPKTKTQHSCRYAPIERNAAIDHWDEKLFEEYRFGRRSYYAWTCGRGSKSKESRNRSSIVWSTVCDIW